MTNTNIREGSIAQFIHPEFSLPFKVCVDTLSPCHRYAKVVLTAVVTPAQSEVLPCTWAELDACLGQDWNVSVRELTPA